MNINKILAIGRYGPGSRYMLNAATRRNIHCTSKNMNHYRTLGVHPEATLDEIKNSYYDLSMKYHPDKNVNNVVAADKFRDITAAYEVLGNPHTRQIYDKAVLQIGVKGISVSKKVSHKYPYTHISGVRVDELGEETVHTLQPDEWTEMQYAKSFAKAQARTRHSEDYQKQKHIDHFVQKSSYHEGCIVSCVVAFLTICSLINFGVIEIDLEKKEQVKSE